MKITRILLIIAMALGLAANASAQTPPTPPPWPFRGPPPPWMRNAPPAPPGGIPGQMKPGEVEHYPYQGPLKVSKMKLLAPGVGWALTYPGNRLFMTRDNGKSWKDITPPTDQAVRERLSDVFFLSGERGWALFARYGEDSPRFDLVSTGTGGKTWSAPVSVALPPEIEHPQPAGARAGEWIGGWGGTVSFIDPLHGWLYVTIGGETMNSFWSFLLSTADGGHTWTLVPNAPSLDGQMLRVNAADGWLLGRSMTNGKELYATHDAGRTWGNVSLAPPLSALQPARHEFWSDYGMPRFADKKHGKLRVSFSEKLNGHLFHSMALYSTNDGGLTWKPSRIISDVPANSLGSTTAGGAWLVCSLADHRPTLIDLSRGEAAKLSFRSFGIAGETEPGSAAAYHWAQQLSFVSPAEGWVLISPSELLSTTDGGHTWLRLTIEAGRNSSAAQYLRLRAAIVQGSSGAPSVKRESQPAGAGPVYNIDMHLGFDTYSTPDGGTIMQSWWNQSPYYDIGVYLNGAENHRYQRDDPDDPNLENSDWVNSVTGQGWGLIPIWVGLQAPVGCIRGVYHMSRDPKVRRKEADADAVYAEQGRQMQAY